MERTGNRGEWKELERRERTREQGVDRVREEREKGTGESG